METNRYAAPVQTYGQTYAGPVHTTGYHPVAYGRDYNHDGVISPGEITHLAPTYPHHYY